MKSKLLRVFYKLSIGLNIIILTLYYHRQPANFKNVLNFINRILISFVFFHFFLRIFCKITIKSFLNSNHNRLVAITLLFTFLSDYLENSNKEINSISKALQVLLSYHIVKRINIVKRLFHTILLILPHLSHIFSLMLLVLYIYSIIGMEIFAYLKPQNTANGYDVDFRTFSRAIHTLIRVMSSEMWFNITSDCTREIAPNFVCYDIRKYEDFLKYGI